MAFDEKLHLRAANHSAGAILGIDFAPLVGSAAARWPAIAPGVAELGQQIAIEFARGANGEWEQQVERPQQGRTQLLLLRGTRLPARPEAGSVVVFDDITHLAEAQRDAAWAEVARRLAHEIKNPLTPIQLSAERLKAKLAGKLAEADAEMLKRSTQTIVNQVAALKNMVDAFSQYARTPEPSMRELDLNALMREVLTLYESSLGASRAARARGGAAAGDRGPGATAAGHTQSVCRTAQDALADTPRPRVTVASDEAGGMVRFTVTDNGSGFPEHLMQRVFEPYVTTKPKGTGLGLVIVKKIVEEHGGTVAIANVAPQRRARDHSLPAAARDVARRVTARAQV